MSFASLPPGTDKRGIDPALAFRLLGLWQGPSIASAAAAALFGDPEYSPKTPSRCWWTRTCWNRGRRPVPIP